VIGHLVRRAEEDRRIAAAVAIEQALRENSWERNTVVLWAYRHAGREWRCVRNCATGQQRFEINRQPVSTVEFLDARLKHAARA
jgi:hypothetical protein